VRGVPGNWHSYRVRAKRYVAYYRVSTQKQGQYGLGIEAQQNAVAEFLQQFGGGLVAEFIEVESGKRCDRPEFIKAADYAELANAVLFVAKLERLSRDLS
jgi:DNA invertase Pin-like site-specific DNA recombinase